MPNQLTAVFDTNAIIGLAKAECLQESRKLFGRSVVTPSVVAEVTDPLSRASLTAAVDNWLEIETPYECSQTPLDR